MGPTRIDATLILLRSTHNPLRTPTVDGYYLQPPTIGQRFEFYGQGLKPGTIRYVTTTPVRNVEVELMGDVYQFGTENSLYRLLTH